MNRRIAGLAFALLVLVAAAACRRDDGEPATRETPSSTASSPASTAVEPPPGSLAFGGVTRTYRWFAPSGDAPDGGFPLVLALHGGLGTGDQFARASGLEAVAAREGFVVVFPDGVERTWNGGRCCGQAAARDVDDAGFLAALIDDFAARLPIDRARVFVTGHSNGAIMAFRFACERADLVAAVAPVAGSLEIPECRPSRAVALLAIHGDADQNHPIEGGTGPRSIARVSFASMADSLAAWTKAMSCGTSSASTEGALTTTEWSGCRDGLATRFVVIAGADHPWPGSDPRAGSSAIQGQPSQALDASEAAWAFFATVKRP